MTRRTSLATVVRESMTTPRDTANSAPHAVAAANADAREEASARVARFAARWSELEAAVVSSRGFRHAVNEDCHSALDGSAPLFVVADGVGGGALASSASHELVSHLHARLAGVDPNPAAVRAALIEADREISHSIATRTEASGAATVALCSGRGRTLARWLVAWVGDCRVYRVKRAAGVDAELLTADDSYRRLGEAPPAGVAPDDPARMIGNGAVDVPNIRRVHLRRGEMLVLVSDGVHKHADASDIARLLRSASPLARRCRELVDFARERGSSDDATVLVVRRVERNAGRLARIAAGIVLIALVIGALAWLARESNVQRHAEAVPIDARPMRGLP